MNWLLHSPVNFLFNLFFPEWPAAFCFEREKNNSWAEETETTHQTPEGVTNYGRIEGEIEKNSRKQKRIWGRTEKSLK
jgi:hypothetical protein